MNEILSGYEFKSSPKQPSINKFMQIYFIRKISFPKFKQMNSYLTSSPLILQENFVMFHKLKGIISIFISYVSKMDISYKN